MKVHKGYFVLNFWSHQLYEQRIKTLSMERVINRTRLEQKILELFPQAQEQSDGKNKVFILNRACRK